MSTYVYDLDNTLCKSRGPYTAYPGYSDCEPIWKRIREVRKLYERGHKIIIHTARGMGSCDNNIGCAIAMYGRITLEQLDNWGIPYEEIWWKPSGDFYRDDKAQVPGRDFP